MVTKSSQSQPVKKTRGKRVRKQIVEGVVHIQTSFNNTRITISDMIGNVVSWSSASKEGFKGSRKNTPFAAKVAAETLAKDAVERFGLKHIHVKIKGPGQGRESAVRALESSGLKVLSIQDVTGIPHNGCRPPKRRRV